MTSLNAKRTKQLKKLIFVKTHYNMNKGGFRPSVLASTMFIFYAN